MNLCWFEGISWWHVKVHSVVVWCCIPPMVWGCISMGQIGSGTSRLVFRYVQLQIQYASTILWARPNEDELCCVLHCWWTAFEFLALLNKLRGIEEMVVYDADVCACLDMPRVSCFDLVEFCKRLCWAYIMRMLQIASPTTGPDSTGFCCCCCCCCFSGMGCVLFCFFISSWNWNWSSIDMAL